MPDNLYKFLRAICARVITSDIMSVIKNATHLLERNSEDTKKHLRATSVDIRVGAKAVIPPNDTPEAELLGFYTHCKRVLLKLAGVPPAGKVSA